MRNDKAALLKRNLIAYSMVLPAMLLFIGFACIPAIQSFLTSFTDWDGLRPAKYVGIRNYIAIFTASDTKFYAAFRNNVFWLIFGTTIPVILGLIQANMLIRVRVKRANVFQLIFFLPQILSVTVACAIWTWIFDPLTGPVNALLKGMGLEVLAISWLGDPDMVMKSLLSVYIWLAYGFCTVVFCAAIQGVDTQIYEAATIDGCSRWGQFWNVTLPGIRRTLDTVVLLQIIGSFQVFDVIYIMTKGGPGHSSFVLSYYIFHEGLQSSHVGFATAISITLAAMLFTISVLYNKMTERVDY